MIMATHGRPALRISNIAAAFLVISLLGGAVTGIAPGHAAGQRQADEPFGLVPYPAPDGALWARWRAIQADMDADAELLAACRADPPGCPSPAAVRFLRIVADASRWQGAARLDAVNQALNAAIRWRYGATEPWTAPLATLVAGRGDCTDLSIAKYLALREARVAADDLRILIVWDDLARQYHAVLAARDQRRWLILDNRITVLGEDVEFRNFLPLFAISDQGVRQFSPPSPFRIIDRLAGSTVLSSAN
jgi:predicted transglutaminase-like cysteine proteinase